MPSAICHDCRPCEKCKGEGDDCARCEGSGRECGVWQGGMCSIPENCGCECVSSFGEYGKCSDCGTTYHRDEPQCPDCGTVERVLCQHEDDEDNDCCDLATGTATRDGETIDACDDHREWPY